MTTVLSPIIVSHLEKAATDKGFDQELELEGDRLVFASIQCPRVWLGSFDAAVFLVAFSQQNVVRALGEYGTPTAAPVPQGAVAGRKRWTRRVPKEKVMALKAIVEDLGADRGIIVNEAGFQSGAQKAARG